MNTSVTGVTSKAADKSATFATPAVETRTTGSKNLGVNDFLKLITVQLTSQDPLKPMEDTQFISQMASFTSLEQMQALSKNFSDFTSQQELSRAQDYLGKTVTIATTNAQMDQAYAMNNQQGDQIKQGLQQGIDGARQNWRNLIAAMEQGRQVVEQRMKTASLQDKARLQKVLDEFDLGESQLNEELKDSQVCFLGVL